MGMLFIYVLIFIGGWALTKSPIMALGAVAIFWSTLGFFHDRSEEKAKERVQAEQFTVEGNLFNNGRDDE